MRRGDLRIIALAIPISACAHASVDYPVYVIDPSKDILYAHEVKDDLKLSETCTPDAHDKAKCIAIKTPTYYAMKKELLELRQKVKDCELGPPPK